MQHLANIAAYPILRIETFIEGLITQTPHLHAIEEALRKRVSTARDDQIVALKSVAAYRGGLRVERRTVDEAGAALQDARDMLDRDGSVRLTHRPLLEYLLYAALEEAAHIALPVQFHVAFGDDDADLRLSNPLHCVHCFRTGDCATCHLFYCTVIPTSAKPRTWQICIQTSMSTFRWPCR